MMEQFDIQAIRKELVQALSRSFDGCKGVAVYGAGDTSERWFDTFLDSEEIEPQYFIDDTPAKRGTFLHGRPIISFEEAHTLCKSFIILPCSYSRHTVDLMLQSLNENPIDGAFAVPLDEYVFCKHAQEVLAVYDLLEDDFSKATYANMILARMGESLQNQEHTRPERTYFGISEFAKIKFDEIFVDCGAYVGDTVEEFLKVKLGEFKKIYAFEPSDRNFRALEARKNRLQSEWGLHDGQIELIHAGLSDRSFHTTMRKTMNDCPTSYVLSGKSSDAECSIPVITIDEYFSKQPISFLKVDIEGYEWKMLHGAEQVIKRDRPKLAICIYHGPYDMYRIALKLKEFCPDYKFAVRQHYCNLYDTVLYAYISEPIAAELRRYSYAY